MWYSRRSLASIACGTQGVNRSLENFKKSVTMADFCKGQRVRIVAGTYKNNGAGTYIEACGKVSCRVKVDGDNVQERTLRLGSIEAFKPIFSSFRKSPMGENSSSSYYKEPKTTSQSRHDTSKKTREDLLRELRSLKLDTKTRIELLEKEIMAMTLND
jgi:hypothetical protein